MSSFNERIKPEESLARISAFAKEAESSTVESPVPETPAAQGNLARFLVDASNVAGPLNNSIFVAKVWLFLRVTALKAHKKFPHHPEKAQTFFYNNTFQASFSSYGGVTQAESNEIYQALFPENDYALTGYDLAQIYRSSLKPITENIGGPDPSGSY